jgi:hypothetical protein
MNMDISETLDRLKALHDATGCDWTISIDHCLTDDSRPLVIIRPDEWQIARYRGTGNTLEEAIQTAANKVHQEVIERIVIASENDGITVFPQEDDLSFFRWLKARSLGDNSLLADKYVENFYNAVNETLQAE